MKTIVRELNGEKIDIINYFADPKQMVIEALKPEYVSPLVGWLCHEDCKETGGLFEVGAGYHAKLRWERTRGHSLKLGRGFGPDEVAGNWARIVDFKDGEYPTNINESMAPLLTWSKASVKACESSV